MKASSIGIVFDCDGTLLDSMHVWRTMEAELARRAGITLSVEQRDRLTTMTLPECGTFFHEQFGLGASSADVERMVDELMLDFYRTRVAARPGALAFVQALAARGVRMSVASSSPQSYLQAGLTHCGFTPYFEAIVSVDDVGESKRVPAVWDRARHLMGTARAHTWGMEDSVYAARTLRQAGYRTLGIYDCDESGTYAQLADVCDYAVHDFSELSADTFLTWNDAYCAAAAADAAPEAARQHAAV